MKQDSLVDIKFSETIFLSVVFMKPLFDALFFIEVAKYAYMGLIIASAALLHCSNTFHSHKAYFKSSLTNLIFIIYLIFILLRADFETNDFQLALKSISPFIFYHLAKNLVNDRFINVVAYSSYFVIFSNAALLPFEYGWVYWGTVHTFKGFYFFKMDLAFSLTFSILLISIKENFKLTPFFMLTILLAAIQIALSNSRLNYLTFAILILFLLLANGISPKLLLKYSIGASILAVLFIFLFDSNNFLSPFDTQNTDKFTQGRNINWQILIEKGLLKYDLFSWLFGKGLYADSQLYGRYVLTGETYDAHNEWLHLLITQGIIGTLIYISCWMSLANSTLKNNFNSDNKIKYSLILAFSIIVLQSMTAVVSIYATKTWPLVTLLLLLQYKGYKTKIITHK